MEKILNNYSLLNRLIVQTGIRKAEYVSTPSAYITERKILKILKNKIAAFPGRTLSLKSRPAPVEKMKAFFIAEKKIMNMAHVNLPECLSQIEHNEIEPFCDYLLSCKTRKLSDPIINK
jgi:hypothetical protein